MRVTFVTLFPEMMLAAARHSVLARAEQDGRVEFSAVNPRDFATDAHRTVDDSPFGGGPGMVMKPDVMGSAIDSALPGTVILTEPWGKPFTQKEARQLSTHDSLILVCGHYEGIDGRVAEHYGAEVFSMGDFVLTGGEFPSLIIADACIRLLPGVLGNPESLDADSHSDGLLAGPGFTRPWEWRGLTPPEVLRSGNHATMDAYRRADSLRRTRALRPDLFCQAELTEEDLRLLSKDS